MVKGVIVGMKYRVIINNPSSSLLSKGDVVEVVRVSLEDNECERLVVRSLHGHTWHINNAQIEYNIDILNKGVR